MMTICTGDRVLPVQYPVYSVRIGTQVSKSLYRDDDTSHMKLPIFGKTYIDMLSYGDMAAAIRYTWYNTRRTLRSTRGNGMIATVHHI